MLFLCLNNIRIVELSHNMTNCKIFCGSSQRFAEACGKKTAPRKICAGLLMQSVIRQRRNIAHAGENMLRTIGKALDFLRVGDAAKQSKAHTPFGSVGLKFITKQQAAVINL